MSLEEILGLNKNLLMKFKHIFILLRMSFNLPLKLIYLLKNKIKIILVEWGWTKQMDDYEFYGKTDNKKEHEIREYHISGL